MKITSTKKHFIALLILVVLTLGIITTASAALISSLTFSNMTTSSGKTSGGFTKGKSVSIHTKATDMAGNTGTTYFVKFDGRASGNLQANGVTRSWSTSCTKTSNTFYAQLTHPNNSRISGNMNCYQ
ncbi:MAG: hypothetical protein ACOX3W_02930 [Christensenellaceae bacterium]|jgi:hypothetical protein